MGECCTPCGVQPVCVRSIISERSFQSNAPRAGCNRGTPPRQAACRISINAPHAGCNKSGASHRVSVAQFQSTHPVRGATAVCRFDPCRHFNLTHPVRGAIVIHLAQVIYGMDFNLTHPVRGVTYWRSAISC